MKIDYHRDYKKSYKKLSKNIRKKAAERTALFIKDRNDTNIKDHALKGTMRGLRAFSVTGDYRIIYKEEKNGEIIFLFLDIGTHSQVYSKF